MKFNIGICGSAADLKETAFQKAQLLGDVLGHYKDEIRVHMGGGTGLPYNVASLASKAGVEIVAYSPMVNESQHRTKYPECDITIYHELFYVPENYKDVLLFPELVDDVVDQMARYRFRNIRFILNCDAGVIISGRWGTVNEFTNLYDMGKIIGVLTGTGGIADELPILTQKISKAGTAKVIFHDSPKELVERVLELLKNRKAEV